MSINISTSRAFYRWKPAAWLRVSGEDAATFLQGQFTNDLRGLAAGASCYGLWLTLKGKVLADSFVIRGAAANEFWIGSYFSRAEVIRERLESHVIADDVLVEDLTKDFAGVSILGADATLLSAPTQADVAKAIFVFAGRRGRESSCEGVFRAGDGLPTEWAEIVANAVEIDAEEMTRRRIAAEIPAVPADIGPADLPNEAGLEAEAISYTKGCYLGQEVMARLKSMGQVRRRLLRVSGTSEFPLRPAPVFVGARQVGELRSAVSDQRGGWIGLAMVSLLHVTSETEMAFAAEGTPALRLIDTP